MYYIYKITNIVNNKIYIGVTNNISRRRARHFTDLKCGRHDNHFLQKEFNIYGEHNFHFEEICRKDIDVEQAAKLEKDYIALYDSYRNGYNQNPGGNYRATNGGTQLTWADIFIILAVGDFTSRSGSLMREQFDITNTTVSRIRHGVNHIDAYEAYQRLSEKEKYDIYKIYCGSFDVEEDLHRRHRLASKRKLTKQQILRFLSLREFDNFPKERIAKKYHVATNTLTTIEKGISYQDVVDEYKKMPIDQRKMCR